MMVRKGIKSGSKFDFIRIFMAPTALFILCPPSNRFEKKVKNGDSDADSNVSDSDSDTDSDSTSDSD